MNALRSASLAFAAIALMGILPSAALTGGTTPTTRALGSGEGTGWAPSPAPSGPGIHHASAFGAVGDGVVDDTASIQSALDAAAVTGGWAWLDPGRYRITSPLVVGTAVTLVGDGFAALHPPGEATAESLDGTWLLVDPSMGSRSAVQLVGLHAVVRDLGVWHDQPPIAPGWAPRDFGWAIDAIGTDARVAHVWLANATKGIKGFGRTTVDDVGGQPIEHGIMIDEAYDVVRLRTVTFAPSWSDAPEVLDYQRAHGVGIESRRNDNPQLSFLTLDGYARGLVLSASAAGITSKLSLMDATFRGCGTGIVFDGAGIVAKAARVAVERCATGVEVLQPATVTLASIGLRDLHASAVRVEGPWSAVFLDDLSVTDWDAAGAGWPALVSTGVGSFIRVGSTRSLTARCDAAVTEGDVSATDASVRPPVPATTPVPWDAAPTTPAIDAAAFGAVGDGVTDETAAIQAALDAAASGSRTVRIGPGSHVLLGGIVVPDGVSMTGLGWSVGPPFVGTFLVVPPSNLGTPVTLGKGSAVRDLAVRHEQPPIGPSWTPHPYDWAVRVGGGGSTIRNLFLLNPTLGIEVTADAGSDPAAIVLDRIVGNPLTEGLRLDSSVPVRVDGVHFWPFNGYAPLPDDGTRPEHWVRHHGTGVRIDRSEGVEISNSFTIDRLHAFTVRGSGGPPGPGAYLWNADGDIGRFGITLSGPGAHATFVNAQVQGPDEVTPDATGVRVLPDADSARLVLVNADVRRSSASGLVASNPTADVHFDLSIFRDNDLLGGGAPPVDLGAAPTAGIGQLWWPAATAWPNLPISLTTPRCGPAPPSIPDGPPASAPVTAVPAFTG